jgi:hypothetical protein
MARDTDKAAAADYARPLEQTPRVPELCGNCRHWRSHTGNPSFGQCLLSMRGLPSPLVTPDRSSCSQWTVAERFL